MINIEIVYAVPDRAIIMKLEVESGATVKDALGKSGFAQKYPQYPIDPESLAIFGKLVELSQPLKDKDRIEILRPLLIDPKDARRRRAAEQS